MTACRVVSPLILAVAFGASPAGAARALVVCAPGYPGTTAMAGPTMDAFADAAGRAAGWAEGALVAVYHERQDGGIARLREPDAAFALVPLPFFVEHEKELSLAPRLLVAGEAGSEESWTLVAAKGRIRSPADLSGWEILSIAGYSPAFVRDVALSGWGSIPGETRISFAPAVLSALRRAAAGEKVAVMLDRSQAAALPDLPFAASLESVHRSRPLPATLFCRVGGRAKSEEAEQLERGLVALSRREEGGDLMRTMRMKGFEQLPARWAEEIRRAAAAGSAR